MKITVLTIFPEMIEPFFNFSIMKRAVDEKIIEYSVVNIRDYAEGVHMNTDCIPYGGGAGMVFMPVPLGRALDAVGAHEKRVVFPTPSGRVFNEEYAEELSKEEELVFICGHYEGIDQRIIDRYVDDEVSVGDYVLSSGETAVLVIIDALFRLISGVISEESLREESFTDNLLEYPQYTRPEWYCQKSVPDVLSSGHHRNIMMWRLGKRLEKTMLNRPDLLSDATLGVEERRMLLNILDGRERKWILSEL